MDISIVIPVFNEEENLVELIHRTVIACKSTGASYELILVNDGSSDGSAALMNDIVEKSKGPIVIVCLARNYGQHNAVLAGFSVAKGEKIVTLDADLQNPPEKIPNIYQKLCEGYEVVNTRRVCRHDSFLRKLASKAINYLMRKLCRVSDVHDLGCMLRGYSRMVVDSILQCKDEGIFIPMLALSFARKTIEINVTHLERNSGKSKYNFRKLVALQYDLLITSSTLPLRLLTVMGFIVSFCGIFFGVVILILSQFDKDWGAEGVFALFAIMFVLVGGLFAAIGLLGEYIGKIYLNTRQHPRYIIQSISTKS